MSIVASGETRLMTAEELLERPDDGMRHELIEGELTTMAPAGGPHGGLTFDIGLIVGPYVKQNRLGQCYVAETGFVIGRDPDTVRAPDLAFIRAERVPDKSVRGFYSVVPDLVIEVVSPSDRAGEVNRKALSWLDAGVRLVWVVYPETETVAVHRRGDVVSLLRKDEAVLSGEDVLPGFTARLGDIFG